MADVTPPIATGPAVSIDPDDAAFERRYGPWDPFSVAELRSLLQDFEGTWWIVGGHAIEAFTGEPRPHEDIDVAIFRRDLPALRSVVADRYQLWAAGSGLLRPLDDEFPDLHPETGQVWLREHALAPWRVDLISSRTTATAAGSGTTIARSRSRSTRRRGSMPTLSGGPARSSFSRSRRSGCSRRTTPISWRPGPGSTTRHARGYARPSSGSIPGTPGSMR